MNQRYYFSGVNVVFPRHGFVFHINFHEAYRDLTVISARRKLKQFYTKGAQNDIIHYLKEQKYIIA